MDANGFSTVRVCNRKLLAHLESSEISYTLEEKHGSRAARTRFVDPSNAVSHLEANTPLTTTYLGFNVTKIYSQFFL